MFSIHLQRAMWVKLAVVTAMAGFATDTARAQTQQPPAGATVRGSLFVPHAWSRTEGYEAPDFDRFFPDDPEGGRRLEALWKAADRDRRTDEEVLRTICAGLRRVPDLQKAIIAWVGNRFIWGKTPQDPDAIEIMYHAADFRGEGGDRSGTRYNAVYYGLSVVEPKPPATLHALADLCALAGDSQEWSRIAWGARSQRAELVSYLKAYLNPADEDARERMVVVAKILGGEPDANVASTRWHRKRALARYGDRLPGIKKALREGSSRERMDALALLANDGMLLIVDDSFFEDCRACADDEQAEVRRGVARFVGNRWISFVEHQDADAIALELRLSQDEDREVRTNALNFGLTSVRELGDDVLRRLVVIALTDREPRVHQRVVSRLRMDRDLAAKVLDEFLRGGDSQLAGAAREVYRDVTGRNPPGEAQAGSEVRASYAKSFRDLYEHLGRAYPNFSMKGIDWGEVGRELLPRVALATTEEQFGLLVEELVARLEDSHAVVLQGTLAPPSPDLPRWDPGLACLIDDRGRAVVYQVESASLAEKAGVLPGMTVVSVDGAPAEDAIRSWMQRQRTFYGYSSEHMLRYDAARGFLQRKAKGTKVALVLEETDGRTREVETAADRGPRYLPRLPAPREGIADSADISWRLLEDRIGYIYVRRIRSGLEGSLDRALKDLGAMKGLILDVRGNSGGGFDATTAFRNFDPSADDVAGTPGSRYRGPIALLIDERCISAGEGWASWFIARKRARLFGTKTAGASSRKETYTMSNGLYRVVVPVKAYSGFLDRPIEQRGLEPDVPVRCNAGDLARGIDTIAVAAARWLLTQGGE